MTITAVLVLFATIWFLVLLLSLQIGITTQGDEGNIVAGTHASSPVKFNLEKRIIITTLISIVLCALISGIIISGVITLDMMMYYPIF